MKTISGKDLCKILENKGWILARIHGSHYIYTKERIKEIIVVPVHKNKALKIGLLKKLLKTANINEQEL